MSEQNKSLDDIRRVGHDATTWYCPGARATHVLGKRKDIISGNGRPRH
jgi:hypothetical protein